MRDRQRVRYGLFGFLCCYLTACTGVPDGIEPVMGFDQSRYLGTWYEIARLDHSFEHGLSKVSATYGVNPDGTISVLNRGFDSEAGEWRVFELGENYDHAFVSGFNRNYLWFLARTPQVSESLREQFLETITDLGFESEDLIWLDEPEMRSAQR